VRRWAESQQVRHAEAAARQQAAVAVAEARAQELEQQRAALSLQLREMSGTVLKAVDREHGAIEKAAELEGTAELRAGQLETLKKRMVAENTLQGKRRMRVELEQRSQAEQLSALRGENERLARAANANFEAQTQRCCELEGKAVLLERRLRALQAEADDRLERLLASAQFLPQDGRFRLDLSQCWLGGGAGAGAGTTDVERGREQLVRAARLLAALLASHSGDGKAPVVLSLARNGLTDDHVTLALAKVVQVAVVGAASVHLDLSGNYLSAEGIHSVVAALGRNPLVQHVYVHRDGTVQGLRGSEVVYTIDVGDNRTLALDALPDPASPQEQQQHEKRAQHAEPSPKASLSGARSPNKMRLPGIV
jgi:hypothetical protein